MDTSLDWPSPTNRQPYKDVTSEERELYLPLLNRIQSSIDAIVSLSRGVRYIVENNIPGAFVECGVWEGGNIEVIIKTLLLCNCTSRDIWMYDTFAGFPKPEEVDLEIGVGPALETWERHRSGEDIRGSNWLHADFDRVYERIMALGYPPFRLHFVKGLVEETIPEHAPQTIALARLDTDFYRSTKHEFIHLYPRVNSGGIVIVDDYGAFVGSRQATDEYIQERGLKVYLGRVDEHVRQLVKP